MIIVGCDFHPGWEQVAWLDTETGEQKLVHGAGDGRTVLSADGWGNNPEQTS